MRKFVVAFWQRRGACALAIKNFRSREGNNFEGGHLGRRAMPEAAQWSNDMVGREVTTDRNLLSAFVMIIGGALGIGLPMTLVIVWICS
jgi:hypothetical protein